MQNPADPTNKYKDFLSRYEATLPLREQFTARLRELLGTLIQRASISVHAIEARTKTLSSLCEKLARPGKTYDNPEDQIDDLSGIRVIVTYNADVRRVGAIVESEFTVNWSSFRDHSQTHEPAEFGYNAVHYVIRLGGPRSTSTEWSDFATFRAEIQIKTVLQHAWSAISHSLTYKRETTAPTDARRRLYRVSALLELADQELDASRTEILEGRRRSLGEDYFGGPIPPWPIERPQLPLAPIEPRFRTVPSSTPGRRRHEETRPEAPYSALKFFVAFSHLANEFLEIARKVGIGPRYPMDWDESGTYEEPLFGEIRAGIFMRPPVAGPGDPGPGSGLRPWVLGSGLQS